MLIDLTVRGPHGDRDVRLEAPATTPFGAVRAGLADLVDVPNGSPFHLDDTALADDTALGDTGLRTGSVLHLSPAPPREIAHPYWLQVSAGPAAGRTHPLHRGRVVVGRGSECDIVLDDERLSRQHATLDVSGGRVTVLDHGSTNGSTVDGRPVPRTGAPLDPGAVLRVGDSLLTVAVPSVIAAAVTSVDGAVVVHRPPRPLRSIGTTVVALPSAPTRERPHPVQWIAALVPALAAAGLAWFTGSTMFLLVGLLSPVLLLSTALGDRWHGRRTRRRAGAVHRTAQRAADRALAEALAAETDQRRAAFPDPVVLALTARTPGVGLWGRRPGDPDWLAVRVGSGTAPSRTLVSDEGRERPGGLVRAVPVVVELRTGPLGLAGPPEIRAAMGRWWLAQLAVQHSPEDLSILVLEPDGVWAWTRWLPHARVVPADEQAEVLAQLTAEVEHRRRRTRAGDPATGPVLVLVADGPVGPAFVDVVTRGAEVGVTALWSCADPAALPGGCTAVLGASDGRARVCDGGALEAVGDLVADTVTSGWADDVARALAPLVDDRARQGGRLPAGCTLTGLLGLDTADPADLARRWAASDGRPDTALGVTADGPLVVDLEADGPHALVAGTTGSGKSELLRTWVAGLCLRHPPEEVSVLLVDYKGGAAFAECADLPHCAGLVTDLDRHLTARALRSLDAELRRREVLLRDAGASDLAAYRAAGREPLARLVLVVDEFATLADELPDFVSGLVGVAQRGRSLGIHLVLATQRPGAAVSPEIRANTSLRIALRVTGPGESVDVVGTDDAAAIAPSTPGRAVLADGTGTRFFQAARPELGPRRTSTPRLTPLGASRRADPRPDDAGGGLAELVHAVARAARETGRAPAPSPWLAPLPDHVTTAGLPATAFARADVPAQQRQPSLEVSLEPALSTLVLGTARSGRTVALASIALAAARTHRPDRLELQVVDARGDLLALLDGLPHLVTRLGPDDLELTGTLLERLAGAGPRRRQLLLVDGWDVLVSVLGDDAAVDAEQRLAALVRSPGPVSVVLTGDRTLTAPRFSGAFDRRFALRLGERGDYGALGLSTRDLPVRFPPGRGVCAADGVEFQVAVPAPANGGRGGSAAGGPAGSVGASVRAAVAEVRARSTFGAPDDALRVRPLPTTVSVADLGPAGSRLRVGVGGDGASPVTLDPFGGSRRWLVCGPPRSGRSGVLAVVLAEALRVGLRVLVGAPPRSPVAELATRGGVDLIDPGDRPGRGPLTDAPPSTPTLLLVDDTDAFADTDAGDALLTWLRDGRTPVAVLAAGRPDELALAYRGLAAEVRRSRSGIVLHPGPVDGELFGVRLPRSRGGDPPGRGRLVGDPAWSVGTGSSGSGSSDRIQIARAADVERVGGR